MFDVNLFNATNKRNQIIDAGLFTGIAIVDNITQRRNELNKLKVNHSSINYFKFRFCFDSKDLQKVFNASYSWSIDNDGYPSRHLSRASNTKNKQRIRLHQYLMLDDAGFDYCSRTFVVDHISRKPFNNLRSNLRLVDSRFNHINSDLVDSQGIFGLLGVRKKSNKYEVRAFDFEIRKTKSLGVFNEPIDAALKYDWFLLNQGILTGLNWNSDKSANLYIKAGLGDQLFQRNISSAEDIKNLKFPQVQSLKQKIKCPYFGVSYCNGKYKTRIYISDGIKKTTQKEFKSWIDAVIYREQYLDANLDKVSKSIKRNPFTEIYVLLDSVL